MEPYGLPSDQVDKYDRSLHWRMLSEEGDLSAPTCNDCHGNHGAAPPGISWVGNVCGQCHAVMAGHFVESRHAEVFTLLGTPGCATCHRNHDIGEAGDAMLGLADDAVCSQCHSADDPGGQAAAAMRAMIDSLRTVVDSAEWVLSRAENAGMEVGQAQFEMTGAHDGLVKARAAVHAFNPDVVGAEVEGGLEIAAEGVERGVRALRDLQVRRMGLAASVIVIIVLIVGLVMKIHQIEGRHTAGRTT
jgi:predicted CXXCH cytochrome family protein